MCPYTKFFVMVMTEENSPLETQAYFQEHRAYADVAAFTAWLDASPDAPPMEGDELVVAP